MHSGGISYAMQALRGLAVSALGAIPLGVINVTAMQIAIHQGYSKAWIFAAGAAIVEVIYARVLLVGLKKLLRFRKWLQVMDWLAFAIVAVLAVASLYAAMHPAEQQAIFIRKLTLPTAFLLGMGISAANPMQFPYWFGWSAVFINSGKLGTGVPDFNAYTLGIGIGTLLGLAVFILGGPLLANNLQNGQHWVQWGVGIVLAITALIFLIRLLRGGGSARSLDQSINRHKQVQP